MARKQTWNETKEWDYWYPDYPMCWICGLRTATQAGHGVLNKGLVRNRKKHKHLNKPENLCPQCTPCNMNSADTWENRNKMYNKKCDEMGQERIDNWIESVGLKIPENFIREES